MFNIKEDNYESTIVTLIIQKAIMYVKSTERWLEDFITYEEAKFVHDNITNEHKEFFKPEEGILEELLRLIEDDLLEETNCD
ncbi:hypothetical protein VPHK406_0222 [Vibrio phage K406]